MRLADTKAGDRILVYIHTNSNQLSCGPGMSAGPLHTIPATVIENNRVGGVTLGWKQGEAAPDNIWHAELPVPGFVKAYVYGDHCECLPFSESSTATIAEKNCKQCGKANDLGVSSCWWCTCPNPTT